MKIALRQEDSCSVLEVEGSIDPHNFAVLKAGLTKLLQNGKNRIVLHIKDSDDLSPDVIRELAILDVFARELSGKIVIASDNPQLKTKVLAFAKPPVVGILPTVAKAAEYLSDLAALEGEEVGETLEEVTAQLEAKTKQVEALEAQIKLNDPKELQGLRSENASLKDKLQLLERQVGEFASKRPEPVSADGFLEKIAALEETVKKLSGEKAEGAKK